MDGCGLDLCRGEILSVGRKGSVNGVVECIDTIGRELSFFGCRMSVSGLFFLYPEIPLSPCEYHAVWQMCVATCIRFGIDFHPVMLLFVPGGLVVGIVAPWPLPTVPLTVSAQ